MATSEEYIQLVKELKAELETVIKERDRYQNRVRLLEYRIEQARYALNNTPKKPV